MRWSDVTAAHVAAETERVVATASSLRNDAVLAPSLVQAGRAVTCSPTWRATPTPSRACARRAHRRAGHDVCVAAGARRRDRGRSPASAADQAADILGPPRLAPLLAALGPEHADVSVERVPAARFSVGRVPFMRLRELVFHHVDLDACYTSTGWRRARRTLPRRGGRRLRTDDEAPSVRLTTTEGATCPSSRGCHRVTGRPSGLLLWVARGRTDDVAVDGPAPRCPSEVDHDATTARAPVYFPPTTTAGP